MQLLTEQAFLNFNSDSNDKFVIINAWNEWDERMALEPSDVYGRKFLETIRDVC